MARQRAQSTLLHADDWSTLWHCACGYDNAGRERCLMCGSKAPPEAQGTEGLHAEEDMAPIGVPRLAENAGRKAFRMVRATIGLNLLMQAFVAGFLHANGIEGATAIKISLYSGVAYYAIVALWTLGKAAVLGVKPVIGRTTALVGATEGFIVGASIAVLLVGVVRVIAGRPLLDPTTTYLAAEGSFLGLALGVLVIVVIGPITEELVFRGFLAETFIQRWGKLAAVLISAAAFSLAHLRLMQFWYYALMGIGFALVYLRRGLIGSIAAHATFNGMLVLLAVVAMHGAPLDVKVAGATVAVPPTWRVEIDSLYQDLYALGPLGAQVGFFHQDLPVGDMPSIDQLSQRFLSGNLPLPEGVVLEAVTVNIVDLPAGKAVSLVAQVDDHTGRIVAVPTPGRLWMAVFESDGSPRSSFEFDEMLKSWRVPSSVPQPTFAS